MASTPRALVVIDQQGHRTVFPVQDGDFEAVALRALRVWSLGDTLILLKHEGHTVIVLPREQDAREIVR